MKNMKTTLTIAILAALAATAVATDETVLGTYSTQAQEYQFILPPEYEKSSSWDGISKEIPLRQEEAIEILQKAAKEDHGIIPPLRSIRLSQNYLTKIYLYEADFVLPDVTDPKSNYILLMDGTVVRLTKKTK